jgi:uncharacterized protein with HEPN domain
MNDKDRTIVLKILRYCRQVEETHRQFQEDSALFFSEEKGFIYRNAVSMPILQIGELAKNLSDGFRSTHDAIPWRAIMGMRDIFAHHYGSVDYSELWHSSHEDVEALKSYLEQNG